MSIRKFCAWPSLTLACILALTSCSSEPPAGRPDDYLCNLPANSTEEKLLHEVMRTKSFRTDVHNSESQFSQEMKEILQKYPDQASMHALMGCSFVPKGQPDAGQVRITFEWAARSDRSSPPPENAVRRYNLNGATGESTDTSSHLYTQCVLPGELNGKSKKIPLHAEASFTMNLGPVRDHGTQEEQISFLYLITRRATESLGCENKPLERAPVATPLITRTGEDPS
ncbi:hypothetical protein [Streptomyces sp. NPDC008121]|uniref:hypothetical protein n=1 Tax=Streptomyces sp. NPDC008121 TaxID=3364809 RepID=UPI0036E937F0